MRDLEVGDRLAAGRPAVEDRDARAHPLQHVEEAHPRRVDADAGDDQVRAGQQRGGEHERRRRGDVARHLDLAELEPLRRLDADPPGATLRRTPAAQHPLGVVARRNRLDHGRLPSAKSPASSTQDFTWALATGSSYSIARSGRPSIASGRCPSAVDTRTHPGERLGDPGHRPRGQRFVAPELELLPGLPGEDPGEQADERARVAAVDRPVRRAQPPKADTRDPQETPSSPSSSTPAPSARTARIVDSVSSERPKPRTIVSPSQIAPSRTARCEIDLSPGTPPRRAG